MQVRRSSKKSQKKKDDETTENHSKTWIKLQMKNNYQIEIDAESNKKEAMKAAGLNWFSIIRE